MVSRECKQDESDLDWIQALFPNDKLYLDERGTLTSRKALLRSKSTTLKLQRALSRNSKNESNLVHQHLAKRQLSSPESSLASHGINNNGKRRHFIMESPVQFTIGVQSQDRHLFLFHDFLVIAKLRPSGTYKLKEKVLICELWISNCIEEISEVAKTAENSFVLGWPTTNVVATFRSHPSRTLWKSRLEQLVHEAKENEGLSPSSIHISYSDVATKQEYVKTLQITNSHTALDCVRLVLRQLFLPDEDAQDYQLWVRTGKDESPYPLVGHEFPFCIKMNLIRELLRRSDLDVNVSHVTTDSKCAFILRRRLQSPCFPKKTRKGYRRQTLINWPFKRQVSKSDSVDSALPSAQSCIFGWQVANAWNSGNLPPSIMKILSQLYAKGPQTVGIFRKSANARVLRETKDMLLALPNSDGELSGLACLENSSPVVLACLLKEFLRSLTDCLLQSTLYYEWLDALDPADDWRTRQNFLSLLSKLPPLNLQLLKHLLSVLHCVAQNSSENKMCAENLGVCIGPSLLSPATLYSPTLHSEDVSKKVPKVIAYLIENYPSLFGEEKSKSSFSGSSTSERKDSGIKEREEDSLQDTNGEYHRDDSSSIDSLDRDLFYQDLNEPFSPKPTSKTKVSLTNLSRDSGLTLSDNQLYTPEEEMEHQSSRDGGEPSGVDSRKDSVVSNMTKSVPHMETIGTSSNEVGITKSGFKYSGIDGSCHDLVHRRRFLIDEFFSKTLSSLPRPNAFESNGFQTPRRDSHGPVKLRDHKRLSRNRRQVQSSFEPLQRSYNGGQGLWRSASEESLMRKYSSVDAANDFQKRPALHRKGRAPSPPRGKNGRTLCRGQRVEPDIQAVWFANHSGTMDWKRSQSTSKIDQLVNGALIQGNCVSTGDETNGYAPQLGDAGSISCGELRIYENINNLRHANGMNSGYSEEISNCYASTPKSKQEPPSYEEALCRRNILRRRIQPQTSLEVTDQMRQEQTNLSARARQLYEESLKLYNQSSTPPDKGDLHRAVSVKVSSSSDESTCSGRSTTVNVKHRKTPKLSQRAALRSPSEGGSSLRFRQLPPVHVTDEQISVRSPKSKVIALQRTWRECPDIPDDLQGSINWSVAQLRSLFNPPTSNNNSTCNSTTNNTSQCLDRDKLVPPPYRPPPPTNDTLLRDRKRFDHDKTIVEESFV